MTLSNLAVYGGSGALGRAIVQYFKEKGWRVASIDLSENTTADINAIVRAEDSMTNQASQVNSVLSDAFKGEKLDALFCVAGGWAGGNAANKDFLKNSELMWQQSVQSSLIAAQLAAQHLSGQGLLMFTGAQAAFGPTPGMIGYGMAKAAVHHLVRDLAQPQSGLPAQARVAAICPITLDTPSNRKWVPTKDYSTWTPLDVIAQQLYGYATKTIPLATGSLINIVTKDGKTTFETK